MIDYTKHETLHTGLITLDKSALISPNPQWPELFTDTLEPDWKNIESQARTALGTRGIIASSELFLLSHPHAPGRGYLFRESARVAVEESGFTTYSHDDLKDFVDGHDENDIRVHFLRQIMKRITPPHRQNH